MQKTNDVCDQCKVEVSDSSRIVGWISIELKKNKYVQIRIPNVQFPELECGSRFIALPNRLDFCSLNCLLEYFKSRIG